MNGREKYFFDNISIKDEDIDRAKQAIYSKGIEKHIIILEMLKAWINEDKVPYEYIASFYRYDKRLRKVLFVYISYLEEYYRSVILDQFRFDWSTLTINFQLKQKLKETNNDMDKALERIEFSILVNLVYDNRDIIKVDYVFPKSFHLRKNKDALIELRNSVMHNRLLLLYKGYKECYISDTSLKSNTLKDNVINLINFLPNCVKERCAAEINECYTDNRESKDKTEWILPDFVKVIIDGV